MTNVVHITYTPLAGAPIRIVEALNKYTIYNARLINLNSRAYGNRTYPEDLIWENDKTLALELIANADILHFHHWMNIDSKNNKFGINFKNIAPNAKILRHFHSNIDDISAWNNISKEELLNDKYPRVVIPHYPERSWLDAPIVPNIIPINSSLYTSKKFTNKSKTSVFFSASSENSMWNKRWSTKGLPEIKYLLEELNKTIDFDYSIITNTPYKECQNLKSKSDIVIGDIVTGSYHLTDLESLALSKPTFSYLDNRSQQVLQNLLQCDELPFVNTRLEEFSLPFIELIKNETLRNEIGEFSRYWIENFYNDKILIQHFVNLYNDLLNNKPIKRQKELKFNNAKKFLYHDLYDMQWRTRKKQYDEEINKKIEKRINDITQKKKKILFWGASLFLEDLIKKYKINSNNIVGIIDKDMSKKGDYLGIYQIYTPEDIQNILPDEIIVTIINSKEARMLEIQEFLNKLKLNIKVDIF